MPKISSYASLTVLVLLCNLAIAYPPSGPMSKGAIAWVWGDIETAKIQFAQATNDKKTRVNAWYNLGYIHLWEGQVDSAKALMNRALEFNPDCPPAHLELGKLALEEGKFITADEHFEKAVNIPYAAFRAWHLLGETRLVLGDTTGAEDAFANALNNHPGYHLTLESQARLSLAQSDTIPALSLLDKACHDSPAPSPFRQYLILLEKLGRTEQADSVRKVFHHWYPENTISQTESKQRGRALFEVGERLEYSVRWEFVKLGSIDLTFTEWDTLDNNRVLKLHINVRSAPMIFVVNVKDEYDAWLDPITGICYQFYFHMNSYGVDLIGIWQYRYSSDEYLSRTVVDDGYIFGVRQRLPAEVTDGPSYIYHLRYRTTTDRVDPILFVLDDEYKSGELYPGNEMRIFTVGAEELNTYHYHGILNCRGIVGLSGSHDAWFSKEPVPLLVRAQARIFIGSIKIALVGFTP